VEGQLAGFREEVNTRFDELRELLVARLPEPTAARSTPPAGSSRKGNTRDDGLVMPNPKKRKVKEEEDGDGKEVRAAHKTALSVRK
jgi:hypothetical protein